MKSDERRDFSMTSAEFSRHEEKKTGIMADFEQKMLQSESYLILE